LEEQLKRLLELQHLSQRIKQMESQMETIPGRIEQAGDKLKASDQKTAELEQQMEDAGKEARRLGGEMEDLQVKISGFKSQLNNSKEIKTNEQYRAMERQIGVAEEGSYQVLESQYESEELAKRIASELQRHKVDHQKVQQECEGERLALEAQRQEFEGEKDQLVERISQLEALVDPAILSAFKRVAAVRHGAGVARVVGETCMACHVRLRPQLVCEAKLFTEIMQCDNCKRILLWSGGPAEGANG